MSSVHYVYSHKALQGLAEHCHLLFPSLMVVQSLGLQELWRGREKGNCKSHVIISPPILNIWTSEKATSNENGDRVCGFLP